MTPCTVALAWTVAALTTGIVPVSEGRFDLLRAQRHDASCGYAAVAGVLSGFFGFAVDEERLLADYPPGPGSERIDFLAMSVIFADYGVRCRAFRMSTAELVESLRAIRPVIAHFDRPDGHFVVIVASLEGGVLIADPASGRRYVPFGELLRSWSGAVLVPHLSGGEAVRRCDDAGLRAEKRLQVLRRGAGSETFSWVR